MNPVRIAVVGAGYMGRRHAQKVAALARSNPRVSLAGVADVDSRRARHLAAALGARGASDARELFPHADAVIVSVPTVAHYAVVSAALEAGLDVLVEKPVAASLEEGEELLALARRGGRVLQVGHVEWFNAAMPIIRQHLRAPRFVEAHRLGPFADRSADVDVVRDLMIHDLDILQKLLGEEPARIEAIGVPVISDKIDIANARLEFRCGCVANFTASRVSTAPMRKLRFFQRDAFFVIDFLDQSAEIFRREAGVRSESPRVEMEELKVDPEDALLAQLRSFVDAVTTRRLTVASATDALGALRTALRVVEAMPAVHELP